MATVNLGRIKPVFRGAYSGSTAYVVDDIVTSGGSSYICIQAHGAGTQAVNQTAYWTQMAAGGTEVGTTITTQGDILYRDGSGLQRLAKPASNKYLQNTSGGVLSWETVGGGLLQMVHTEIATRPTRSSGNTYADITGLNVTITPASASNKILIVFNAGLVSNSSRTTAFVLKRAISGGATTILGGHTTGSRQQAWLRCASDSDSNHDYGSHAEYYDSPNTTSAITYTVQWISQGTAYLNRTDGYGDGAEPYQAITNSRIYAQEIGV